MKTPVLTVKYKIILLVVGIAVILAGVNIYILMSYQEPLDQYDMMIDNLTTANNVLIVTREIVDKDFYSTLSNLNDKEQQEAFLEKIRSLQQDVKVLNSRLLTKEESQSLQMISRMMDSFIGVCVDILDETTPMKAKLDNYEKATTVHLLLNKNMGDFISLQTANLNGIARELDHTTGRLWVVSLLILGSILFVCLFGGMVYANKIAESIYREISQQKKAEEIARHQANHDTLTRLPNRRLFEEFTNNLLKLYPDQQMALLFIDLDEFKSVNDSYGHDIGDKLLMHCAEIFTKHVRTGDTVCRFGGDEFIIVITQANREMVERIVNRIISEIRIPFVVNRLTLNITVSIGISCYPGSGEKIDELIVAADDAMYIAKELGKNNFVFAKDACAASSSGNSSKEPITRHLVSNRAP